MEIPVVALAPRMTRWDVRGMRSHPFVSFSASRWAATTGRSTSAVCNWFRTPVRTRWSCGAGLGGVGRLMSVQRWNQTRDQFSARRDSGSVMNCGDFMATAWRKSNTSSQLSTLVVNISAAACFDLPAFANFASTASMVMTLLSSLSSPAPLVVFSAFAHSAMEWAKIFRSSPASNSLWRIAASVRNVWRRTALRGVQSLYFLERTRSPVAARRRTSAIGRLILWLSAAKPILIFK